MTFIRKLFTLKDRSEATWLYSDGELPNLQVELETLKGSDNRTFSAAT